MTPKTARGEALTRLVDALGANISDQFDRDPTRRRFSVLLPLVGDGWNRRTIWWLRFRCRARLARTIGWDLARRAELTFYDASTAPALDDDAITGIAYPTDSWHTSEDGELTLDGEPVRYGEFRMFEEDWPPLDHSLIRDSELNRLTLDDITLRPLVVVGSLEWVQSWRTRLQGPPPGRRVVGPGGLLQMFDWLSADDIRIQPGPGRPRPTRTRTDPQLGSRRPSPTPRTTRLSDRPRTLRRSLVTRQPEKGGSPVPTTLTPNTPTVDDYRAADRYRWDRHVRRWTFGLALAAGSTVGAVLAIALVG